MKFLDSHPSFNETTYYFVDDYDLGDDDVAEAGFEINYAFLPDIGLHRWVIDGDLTITTLSDNRLLDLIDEGVVMSKSMYEAEYGTEYEGPDSLD